MGGAQFGFQVRVDYAESYAPLDKRVSLIYHVLYDPSRAGTIPAGRSPWASLYGTPPNPRRGRL